MMVGGMGAVSERSANEGVGLAPRAVSHSGTIGQSFAIAVPVAAGQAEPVLAPADDGHGLGS